MVWVGNKADCLAAIVVYNLKNGTNDSPLRFKAIAMQTFRASPHQVVLFYKDGGGVNGGARKLEVIPTLHLFQSSRSIFPKLKKSNLEDGEKRRTTEQTGK